MNLRLWLRFAVIAFLLMAMVGGGVFVFRLATPGAKPIVMFPAGERFDFVGCSWNGVDVATEPPWQQALRRFMPKHLASMFPAGFSSSVTYGNSNTVALWFTLTDATGSNVSIHPWQWNLAVGDDGFTYPMGGGGGSSTHGDRVYHHLDLQGFPRRQKDFELRFLDGQNKMLGSIRVPNPRPGPFPTWKPEALPIEQTNGLMAVRLDRLEERGRGEVGWINAKWTVIAAEPNWRKAQPQYQIYEDATGNQGGRLAFTEPAWKLTLPFHRNGWTNFSDAEKFLLGGLNTPVVGGCQFLLTNFLCAGVNITVQALAASGMISITNGTNYSFSSAGKNSGWSTTSNGRTEVEAISSPQRFFLIQTSKPQEGDDLRFRIVGVDGVELKSTSNGWHGTRNSGRRYKLEFDVTSQVESVSLEIIVSRPRVFEFFVNPAEVQRMINTNL